MPKRRQCPYCLSGKWKKKRSVLHLSRKHKLAESDRGSTAKMSNSPMNSCTKNSGRQQQENDKRKLQVKS